VTKPFVDTVQREIAEEKAGTLGRTGQRLEAAVASFREHEGHRTIDAALAHATRERLLWEVAERAESFVVQREACGLRDSRDALAFYGVPREAAARIGAKRPQHWPPRGTAANAVPRLRARRRDGRSEC
jgi:hypothetical protein